MNIVQREVALSTNAFLKCMRSMQPRQFNVEAFNGYIFAYAAALGATFQKSNPGFNINEFVDLCVEGV